MFTVLDFHNPSSNQNQIVDFCAWDTGMGLVVLLNPHNTLNTLWQSSRKLQIISYMNLLVHCSCVPSNFFGVSSTSVFQAEHFQNVIVIIVMCRLLTVSQQNLLFLLILLLFRLSRSLELFV